MDFVTATQLVETVARAIKTVTESLRDSVKAGLETVDLVSARNASKRTAGVHRMAMHLVARQGIYLMPRAEEFLRYPSPQTWQQVRHEIQGTLDQVEPLAQELGKMRGDFLLEPAYAELLNAIGMREKLLREVLAIEAPPVDGDGRQAFEAFLKSYVVLVRELQGLNRALAAYLRQRSDDKSNGDKKD